MGALKRLLKKWVHCRVQVNDVDVAVIEEGEAGLKFVHVESAVAK
jgi:hypothetical protein